MKKALLAGLCFVLIGFVMVNGTFALPDMDKVFQTVEELLGKGIPELGGEGKQVHVSLVSDDTPQQLSPGGSASKTAYVKNEGTGDVYFRLVYAVQYNAESWNYLDIDFTTENDDLFTEHSWQDIEISEKPYKMKVFTYNEALRSEMSSPEVSISIGLDTAITSEQMTRYGSDFVQMQVLAIEPAPFVEKGYSSAKDALDLALPLNSLNPF